MSQSISSIKSLFPILFLLSLQHAVAQTYYARANDGNWWELEISTTDCDTSCVWTVIGPSVGYATTYCPNGVLYGMNISEDIYVIDPATGAGTLFFDNNNGVDMNGLVCSGDSIFYAMQFHEGQLYSFNVNTGEVTLLGETGINPAFDMIFFEGEFYVLVEGGGLALIDVDNPSNSSMVMTWVDTAYWMFGITASDQCHILIGMDGDQTPGQLVYINLVDETITPLCPAPFHVCNLVSFNEYSPAACEIYLDLDCDDSSGADEADFNAPEYTCITGPVRIADDDISIKSDAIITAMTVELITPLPDDPNEILTMIGAVGGINVAGSGTTMITLSNSGGAKIADFQQALRQIFYENTLLYPTAGLRTAEVQFFTASGAESNIGTAFIQVNELPILQVDIGPDQIICEDEMATFTADINGVMYDWSNGESTQSITVNNSGQYVVTVSSQTACPGIDTAELEVLPVIHVSLTGETEVCDNEDAELIITTDSSIPVDIEINVTPGASVLLQDVSGSFTFTDSPQAGTVYTISEVTSSQEVCIRLVDSVHSITVHPTYGADEFVLLCDGDSILIGDTWEHEEGEYEIVNTTVFGCDSTILYTVELLPSVQISNMATTCDSAEAGIIITHLDNPNGCDTVLITTVVLLSSDTTLVTLFSCNLTNVGTSTQSFLNQQGCDSLVISTTYWIPPADTSIVAQTTCDSTLLGVFQWIGLEGTGCDSMVITTITLAPSDTTTLYGTSCDTAAVGVFQSLFSNIEGCDSLVITSIVLEMPDTTYQFSTSCDSASLGVFESHFTTSNNCDSTVFTTVTYSAQDSTFIADASCDPADVGVFILTFTNQFGCDSIVTTTVSLLGADSVFTTNTTCIPAEAGIFIQNLVNQAGCDSIVTNTIALLPSNATDIFGSTCISSEAGIFVSTLINQYGCDSIVTLTVSLVDADTTRLNFMTCFESEVGITASLHTGQDGCDSLVIESTLLFSLFSFHLESVFDFNGYDISCMGGSDGGVSADVNGTLPFSFEWSTLDDEQSITGLSAGDYAVTITDGNGCIDSGVISLIEPSALALAFEISEPDCFESGMGSITVLAQDGVEPYTYSLDGTNFQASSVFDNLPNGVYQITALDANDCATTEIISIHVPLSIQVELGDNQIISLGDSAEITAVVNLPFDSIANIQWTGIDSIDCPNCLTQIVAPIITTAYSISVSSIDGCADSDSMHVFVSSDHDFYIPNIFSPNGDGINDVITVYTSPDVEAILTFSIFDRWGNLVFQHDNAEPVIAWDGRFKGKTLNPGVFTYVASVKYEDGLVEKRYGDITLIR